MKNRIRTTDKKGEKLNVNENYRSDGQYFYNYKDPITGKRSRIYSSSLAGLRRKEVELKKSLSAIQEKEKEKPNSTIVNELFNSYISEKNELRESTILNYKTMYNKHIRGRFGTAKVVDVTVADVEKLYRRLHFESNLRMSTIGTIHNILHPLFDKALDQRIIDFNPSDRVMKRLKSKIKEPKKKVHALTRAQQKVFLDYVAQHPIFNHWFPIFVFLLGTGLRIGECLGMRWSDLEDERMIHVVRSLTYRPSEKHENHCIKSLTDLKTDASHRSIPLLDTVKDVLVQEKQYNELMGFYNVKAIDGVSDFIFLNRNGQARTGKSLNQAIDRIIKHYNAEEMQKAEQENREAFLLPHFSCHNLRHTFCTRLVEMNVPPKAVQGLMGHSDYKTSMNIYAEIFSESMIDLLQDLNWDKRMFPSMVKAIPE